MIYESRKIASIYYLSIQRWFGDGPILESHVVVASYAFFVFDFLRATDRNGREGAGTSAGWIENFEAEFRERRGAGSRFGGGGWGGKISGAARKRASGATEG